MGIASIWLPNVGVGSVAPDRHARDVAAMSASHPITTELVRHNEPALRANNGHLPDDAGILAGLDLLL